MAINSSLSSESSPVVYVDHEGGIGPSEPSLRPPDETIIDVRKPQDEDSPLHTAAGASFIRTCFNGLNALSGVGILSIPYALANGGWTSLVFVFIIAATCCYTGLLIQRCMSRNPNIKTYPDIGDFAFGHRGRIFTSVILFVELYLVAIGFLILEGDNLNKLFPGTRLSIGSLTIAGKQLFVLLAALVILPTTLLRSMGLLAFISAGGVLASLVLFSAVLFSSVHDVGFGERGRLVNVEGLPTALGLYTLCYCGHAVFPNLCTSMKDKPKFSKVLLVCYIFCTINYTSMAILGYLTFGDDLKSQITLNLPLEKISSQIAIYTTLINPFAKYALMTEPIVCAIEKNLESYCNKRLVLYSCVVRALLVASTAIVALLIPFFGYLMAFVGSLLSVMVSILLPCVFYIKIFKLQYIPVLEMVVVFWIMVMGFLIAVLGTYSSVKQIFQSL